MNNRGFSLMEMEVSLVVAAILVLTIGVLSQISLQADTNKRRTAQIYYDLDYAVRMAQNKIRPSSSIQAAIGMTNWVGTPLMIDSGAIGLWDANAANGGKRQFIYMSQYFPDPLSGARDLLMEMPVVDSYNFLNFSYTFTGSAPYKQIQITISGEREMANNVTGNSRYHNPFSIQFTVTRRPI